MPLFVVASPIGNPGDWSARAHHTLSQCSVIIGEEPKALRGQLKTLGLLAKPQRHLNEHSDRQCVVELAELCEVENVALLSDCGTPGLCDPGASLLNECFLRGVRVVPIPGVSSLTALLSLSPIAMPTFFFRGFLPAKTELRSQAFNELKVFLKTKTPVVLMDTPYRLHRFVRELSEHYPDHFALFGVRLTQAEERVFFQKMKVLVTQLEKTKAEFISILYPKNSGRTLKR